MANFSYRPKLRYSSFAPKIVLPLNSQEPWRNMPDASRVAVEAVQCANESGFTKLTLQFQMSYRD